MSSCAQCSHAASSDATQLLHPIIAPYPSATADEASALEAAFVKIAGGGGTGKTETLIKTALRRINEGADPSSILFIVNTADAAREVSVRLRAASQAAQSIRVITIREICTEILTSAQAKAATGRTPRILTAAEYNFLLEDLKTLGQRPGRLKKMLNYFYYQWSQLEPEEEWLLPAEESDVRHSLDKHLRLRHAMLIEELSPLTVAFLRSEAGGNFSSFYATVLVDDYQNLSKASQEVCALLSGESLTVTGNENQAISLRDPHPFPLGFTCFENHFDAAVCVQLTENARCAARVAAMSNNLCRQKPLSEQRTTTVASTAKQTPPIQIKWSVPSDEFPGIAAYLKKLLAANAELDASDIYIIAPNKTWARTMATALAKRGIDSISALTGQPLGGDPRNSEKAPLLTAYTKLSLLADPADVVAWRSWCGFDDYLCYAGAWCKLEAWAQAEDLGLTDALAKLATLNEAPFLEADVLAERYQTGKTFIEKNAHKTGFALTKVIADGKISKDLSALLEPIEGDETASVLFARVLEHVLDPQFGGTVRSVRIGSYENLQGLEPRVLIVSGLIDGFMPSRDCFDVAILEEDREKVKGDQRRVFYNAITKTSGSLILSTIQKADLEGAERLKMEVRRVKMEHGERFAMLSPSVFIAESGDAVPGAVSGEQFLSEL